MLPLALNGFFTLFIIFSPTVCPPLQPGIFSLLLLLLQLLLFLAVVAWHLIQCGSSLALIKFHSSLFFSILLISPFSPACFGPLSWHLSLSFTMLDCYSDWLIVVHSVCRKISAEMSLSRRLFNDVCFCSTRFSTPSKILTLHFMYSNLDQTELITNKNLSHFRFEI